MAKNQKIRSSLKQKMPNLWRICGRNYSNTEEPNSSFRCKTETLCSLSKQVFQKHQLEINQNC